MADEMLTEYDFNPSEGVRGKYYRRLMEEGANVVTIQPDVFEVFPDSESVNAALRGLIKIAERVDAAEKKTKNRKRQAVKKTLRSKRASSAARRTSKGAGKP